MSSERISQLHEQASERYLDGDYDGALQAWRDVLALDPENEQARDGVRLAAQYAAPHEDAPPPPPEIEEALEEGLHIFDSIGAGSPPAPATEAADHASADPAATMSLDRSEVDALIDGPEAAASAQDPSRQAEGIDFGDLSNVEAIPLGGGTPGTETAPATETAPVPEAAPAAQAAGDDVGLAPSAPDPPSAPAAAVELKRRVSDLLTQARMKADAGEREEALAILSRLAILDEDNAEAQALRETLEGSTKTDLDAIENAIIEGVAALEADKLDEAETWMRKALALAPDHREALHYLETIQARRAHADSAPGGPSAESYVPPIGEEDLLGDVPNAAEPEAVPLADVPVARPQDAFAPRSARTLEPPAVPARRRAGPLSPKLLLAVGVLGAAGVAGFLLVPRLTGGAGAPAAAAPAASSPVRSAPKPAAKPSGDASSAAPASPEDRAKAVSSEIADGRRAMDGGDFGAAVISFNDALKLDPANPEAKAGLHQAGQKYKEQRAREQALDGIRLAFRDGEYTSALRAAYRLPEGVDKSVVERIKVLGWYDLGVVALRAGDCKEAESHFKDALAIAPNDAESKRLFAFAGTCQTGPQDRKFLDFVEALPFRTPQF